MPSWPTTGENTEDKWLVVCNLTGEEQEVFLPDKVKEVLLANGPVPEDLSAAVLPAYAALSLPGEKINRLVNM
jgi:hypothetical protein